VHRVRSSTTQPTSAHPPWGYQGEDFPVAHSPDSKHGGEGLKPVAGWGGLPFLWEGAVPPITLPRRYRAPQSLLCPERSRRKGFQGSGLGGHRRGCCPSKGLVSQCKRIRRPLEPRLPLSARCLSLRRLTLGGIDLPDQKRGESVSGTCRPDPARSHCNTHYAPAALAKKQPSIQAPSGTDVCHFGPIIQPVDACPAERSSARQT
jgi:hypothetical protein